MPGGAYAPALSNHRVEQPCSGAGRPWNLFFGSRAPLRGVGSPLRAGGRAGLFCDLSPGESCPLRILDFVELRFPPRISREKTAPSHQSLRKDSMALLPEGRRTTRGQSRSMPGKPQSSLTPYWVKPELCTWKGASGYSWKVLSSGHFHCLTRPCPDIRRVAPRGPSRMPPFQRHQVSYNPPDSRALPRSSPREDLEGMPGGT